MSAGKDAILSRIRTALGEAAGTRAEVPRAYRTGETEPPDVLVTRLVERLEDYRSKVHHLTEEAISASVERICRAHGVKNLMVPADLPPSWLPPGLEVTPDDGLSYAALEGHGGVLTGCALAVAQTGTLVLDAGHAQGRRVLSLLPDLHLCVVFASQVVGGVPEAIRALEPAITAGRPLTLISGPSATSDIELSRVEGVHGPRKLEVLLVERT